jgi:hypothetical protein
MLTVLTQMPAFTVSTVGSVSEYGPPGQYSLGLDRPVTSATEILADLISVTAAHDADGADTDAAFQGARPITIAITR